MSVFGPTKPTQNRRHKWRPPVSIGPARGQLAQTFTLEALRFNCDTGAPGLHVFRCLLRLATLSEHFPRIGTGINVWEKTDRETQGSWAPTGLAVGNSPLVLRAFFAREKCVLATTFCSNSSIDFSGRICGCWDWIGKIQHRTISCFSAMLISCAFVRGLSPNRMQVFGLGWWICILKLEKDKPTLTVKHFWLTIL